MTPPRTRYRPVRDALAHRLARLSAPCAEALTVSALAGPRVWVPTLLARVLPGVDVAAVLDEAVRARVLVTEPGRAHPDPVAGATACTFAHDLFRETAAAVPPPRQLELHARIARALEDLRNAGALVTAAEVATHLIAAQASASPSGTRPFPARPPCRRRTTSRMPSRCARRPRRRPLPSSGIATRAGTWRPPSTSWIASPHLAGSAVHCSPS